MINNAMPILVRMLARKTIVNNFRTICVTGKKSYFYERDRKSGYEGKSDYVDEAKTIPQKIRQGWRYLLEELKLFKEEIREMSYFDPVLILRRGEVDVQWRFEGNPNILKKWIVTSDSDHNEGNSVASIQLTKTGRGIFTGTLDPKVIRDGKIKRTGYCNLTSVKLRKSFQRLIPLNWGPYTHLIMRIRGDGRNYLLQLSTPGDWDMMWNDSYQYVLHTRGGPYWQFVRIPFSKFFFVSKGRVQDIQDPVPTWKITTFGITASDKIPGNFKLEIDYIGVEFDPVHVEEHAYELYKAPNKFCV